MITVRCAPGALTLTGHAGYAPHGSDIVCAAASMLAMALAQALEELPGSGVQTEAGAGRMQIRLAPERRARRDCAVLLAGALAGFRLLARQVPEHVRVEGGDALDILPPRRQLGVRPPHGQKGEPA